MEHGLSVIEKPGLSKGYNRAEYLGGGKAPSARDKLWDLIDASLCEGKSFDGFLAAMKGLGCEVKRGKHLAFKIPDGKKFIRCDSLGDDYTEAAIYERLSGKRIVEPKQRTAAPVASAAKPNLLIDIQSKMQQGKGEGYRHWATKFNLKEMSKTLIYLQENGLENYEILTEKTAAATARFNETSDRIKEIDARLDEIAALQKHIGAYGKTRDVYRQYRESGWNKKFYAQYESDIISHKAAKKHFDSLGLKKLLSMQSLRQEYATLAAEKKKLYQGYRPAREEMIALLRAKNNVDRILGEPQKTSKTYDRDAR